MGNIGACSWGQKYHKEVYVILRVVTGLVFLFHGWAKVTMGADATAGFFGSVGIPAAALMGFLVTWGEVLGGIALIVGAFTHWVAKLNMLIMLGAIYFVHLPNGYDNAAGGYEYALLLLVVNAFIATTGAGIYSIDERRAKSRASHM